MKFLGELSILLLVSSAFLVGDVEAGWKFWKKDDKSTTTSTTTTTTTTTTTALPPTRSSVGGAIASAGNPGLAVGVGTTGSNVNTRGNVLNRNNVPQRPNPGTEVAQEFPGTKPVNPAIGGGSGKNYRDWALDLTGAGEPGRPAPKLPSQGPVIGQTGTPQQIPNQPALGNRPGSQPTPQTRPARPQSTPIQPTPETRSGSSQTKPSSLPNYPTQPQTSTLHVGPITPAPGRQSSTTPPAGKSWAQVASGGSFPTQTPTRPPNKISSPGTGVGAIGTRGAVGAATVPSGGRVYSSNPTYSKGNTVTDEDLEKLSEALWIKDSNNAWRHIRLNLQKQTSSSSQKDEAPEPLLTVNPAALQIPTIDKVLKIYDNYQLDTRTNEYISPAQRNEESLLVDTFLSTNVLSAAMRFLADKGFVRKDYYDYKDTLRRMWFNLYSRGEGKIGSSGFEHVFLTETKLGTEISGLHNWIYFNAEEVKKRADYLGYIKKVDLGDKAAIVKFHAKFNNIDKPVTSMFIGTSPELEMALYTVCFFARPDQNCPVSLGGTKFNIVTHKFRYRGYDLVGSAYPEI